MVKNSKKCVVVVISHEEMKACMSITINPLRRGHSCEYAHTIKNTRYVEETGDIITDDGSEKTFPHNFLVILKRTLQI